VLLALLLPRWPGVASSQSRGSLSAPSAPVAASVPGWQDNRDLPVFEPEPDSEPLAIAWPEATKPAPERPRPTKTARAAKPAADPAAGEVGDGVEIAGPDNYAQRVRQHLASFVGPLSTGGGGEARVQFVVQPNGRVSQVELVRRSGNPALDMMALALPRKAQPLPIPEGGPQRLEVPVQALPGWR
jgi:protein TonB